MSVELSRLLAAAVINRSFCKMLLTQRAKAIERGYGTETFALTPAERKLIFSIQATTLEDFADQLLRAGETESEYKKPTLNQKSLYNNTNV